MNYKYLPAALSFFCGFASLSIEILWIRLYGFARLSTPSGFGFVLMAYLLGIAVGAAYGSRACRLSPAVEVLWNRSATVLLISALATLLMPQLFVWAAGLYNAMLDVLLVGACSAVLAYVFPIAHHLGADAGGDRQGQRFATVYVANVCGAALGPLLTGYVLLEWMSLQQSFISIALLQLLAGVLLFAKARVCGTRAMAVAGMLVVAVTGLALSLAPNPHGWIEQTSQDTRPLRSVTENRHGVITIFEDTTGGDVVYGGNVYDGRTNLDLALNTNGLDRVALLGILKPQPRRVLIVGLSIGTWLALVRQFPDVEHIDVVEINSGYVEAAAPYVAQSRAIQDPRVHMAVDDARRWLRMNPDKRYDLVVMNTTWHWRANAGVILSYEFLQLVKRHMAPGAVMAFNTTGSLDAFYTATQVFPAAYRYGNFVYSADFDFRPLKNERAISHFLAQLVAKDAEFTKSNAVNVERFLGKDFLSLREAMRSSPRQPELVTDDNLITEFKYGKLAY